jgi:hypothetical protein
MQRDPSRGSSRVESVPGYGYSCRVGDWSRGPRNSAARKFSRRRSVALKPHPGRAAAGDHRKNPTTSKRTRASRRGTTAPVGALPRRRAVARLSGGAIAPERGCQRFCQPAGRLSERRREVTQRDVACQPRSALVSTRSRERKWPTRPLSWWGCSSRRCRMALRAYQRGTELVQALAAGADVGFVGLEEV